MSNAHEELKREVAERLATNRPLIEKKREEREALRLEIAELREAIETDERLERALNPKKTAAKLYGEDDEGELEEPAEAPAATAPSFRPE
jgi:hypothetical protein